MSVKTSTAWSVSSVGAWLRGFWAYYRAYTHTAIHAAAAAALTGFGLLIFIDPLFAWLALASYICPPVGLYLMDRDAVTGTAPSPVTATPADEEARAESESDTESDSDDGDTDTDFNDGDTDSDRDNGDADTDADGADADADADGTDADADS